MKKWTTYDLAQVSLLASFITIAAALHGMIFTTLTVRPLKQLFEKISKKTEVHHHVKRAL